MPPPVSFDDDEEEDDEDSNNNLSKSQRSSKSSPVATAESVKSGSKRPSTKDTALSRQGDIICVILK